MSKHTPGPWETVTHTWNAIGVYAGNRGYVCRVTAPEEASEQEVSVLAPNACLISAAPDLLQACNLVLAWQEHVGGFCTPEDEENVLEPLRAAIAKAEGEK